MSSVSNNPVYIIAEAGVNHIGSLDKALQLIDVAAEAGADAVKFQSFRADRLVAKDAPKADYQVRQTGETESQFEMLRKLELSPDMHRRLIEHCVSRNIQFLSTPFDIDSARMLAHEFDLPRLKIPSGEITNGPLLLAAARTGKPLILSTGMATLAEVGDALAVLAYGYLGKGEAPSRDELDFAAKSAEAQRALVENVALLHCTTEYPAPFDDVNLRAMDTLRDSFGLPVGYSDHTVGISVTVAAAARGAEIVEKHFTLDRSLPGPDHAASLEPEELRAMVRAIREVEAALGSAEKKPAQSERGNMPVARKSIFAAEDIAKGEAMSAAKIVVRRPGTGVSPMAYWSIVGQTAKRAYRTGEEIEP
jgi:N-acetylneuraminate synthase